MNMSFIEEMSYLAQQKSLEKQLSLPEKKQRRKTELYYQLTKKYHHRIYQAIVFASSHGKLELYMNFSKDEFKANFPGLGSPRYVCSDWLKEMCTSHSKYLNSDERGFGYQLTCFKGLKFDVWNNRAFTVHFTWPEHKTKETSMNNLFYNTSAPPPSPRDRRVSFSDSSEEANVQEK